MDAMCHLIGALVKIVFQLMLVVFENGEKNPKP